MRTIQRVYIYIMAYASLMALTIGVTNITSSVSSYFLGLGLDREDFALWAGIIVVALPLHAAHIFWANARARASSEEREAALRKLYIYAVAALGVFLLGIFVDRLLERSLSVLLGAPLQDGRVWWLTLWRYLLNTLWALLMLWYAYLLVHQDGDYLREPDPAAVWRRLFVLATGVVGLVLMVGGALSLLQTLLLLLVPPLSGAQIHIGMWWHEPLTRAIALFVVGLGLWRWAWDVMDAWGRPPVAEREQATLSRQLFYYVGVALGVGLSLVGLGYLLRQGLWALFGVPWGARHVWWPKLALWLAALPTGVFVWWTYRRRVWKEQAQMNLPWYHLAVGRLYTYVVSAVALAVLWVGAVDLLRVVTAYLLRPTGLSFDPYWWRRVLAIGLALTLVAAPTWFWHWRRIEDVAIMAGDVGQRERSSLLRRVYLYGVSLVAGLVVLVFLARVAYYVWLWVLRVPTPNAVEELANAMGPALVALVVWAYHMRVIRRDNTLQHLEGEDVEERRMALLSERERLLKRLQDIEEELSRLQAGE